MSFTKEQIDLEQHIEHENARFADSCFSVVTDPAHWAGYGITTIAQYEHYMLSQDVVNMYKEVNGIKPRWWNMDEMSIEQLQSELDSLCEQAQQQDEEFDNWSEMIDMQDRIEHELEPTKYELMAEQAGF